MRHAFGTGSPFSVGIEEELFLVDPATRRLSHTAENVVPAMAAADEEVGYEAYACELELRSSPCRDAAEATAQLARLRERAGGAGATLLGAGVHPTAPLGDVRLVDAERYRRAKRKMRGLFARTPECALHVHVGMPDPDTAVRAFNGLREHLPLLQGLSASSPWWFGMDSGLASSRFSLVRAFPSRGVPRAFESFDHYAETVDAVAKAGDHDDYTFVWWDVRLHPRLGTVEVREMDSQYSLDRVAGLAALVQALARHEAELPPRRPLAGEVIAQSSFAASRDGLDTGVFDGDEMRPLRDVAARALAAAGPHARELGSEGALEGIERILREGCGAARQRAQHGRAGMDGLLGYLVEETATPLTLERIR